MTLPKASLIKTVVLYDLQGAGSGITAGTLSFSDGSYVSVTGSISQYGRVIPLGSAGITTSTIRFTVTSAKVGLAVKIGLAELQAYNAVISSGMLGTDLPALGYQP